MKSSLLESIICPKCAQKFDLKPKKVSKNEIIEGDLICLKKHRFKVKNGIPRLVVDKEKIFVKTEDAFSAKWKKYNKVYHGKKWFDTQKKWFLERFGWKNSKNF